MRPALRAAALLAGSLAAACGSEGPAAPPPAPVLTLVSGDAQSGTVGLRLPLPLQISVSNSAGPVAGVVVSFRVESGGGSLSRTQATTTQTGTVSADWTLGGSVGEQRVTISAAGAASLTATAAASPGAPTVIIAAEGNGQFGVVRRALPLPVRIKVTDLFGNPLGSTPVRFSISLGGGTIADSTATTDATGFASPGQWTLGPTPGFNRLGITAGEATGEVIAIGTAAAILPTAGTGQTANAGTLAAIPPTVTAFDGDGQPLPGTAVTFAVRAGDGSVRSPSQVTGPDGTARPDGWILGLTPGENRLEASATGVAPAVFSATGVPAVPASIVPTDVTSFEGFLGNFLDALPEVRVTDASGAPVAGVALTWSVAGGGTIAGTSATTDFDGRGTARSWRLGPGEPSQAIQVTAPALPPIAFTASATLPPTSQFDIEVRYPSAQPTAAQKAAFDQAAARWSESIVGDLTDIPLDVPVSSSGCYPALNETVDDLLIFADLVEIDGVGGVLGSAGPCLIRTENTLTVVGRMRFDTADLATLEANGQLRDVIVHEMGHVIGLGSLWQPLGLLVGAGQADPFFTGRTAQAAFLAAAGPVGFPGKVVPVENTGGAGTRDGHWRESVLRTELMTGFLNAGANPLSAISIASLGDMGYLVNDVTGDAYSLPQLLMALGTAAYELREAPPTWSVFTVNRRGRIDGVLPRLR
jgi:hypothetical protein